MHNISGPGPPSWRMCGIGTRRLVSGIDQVRRIRPEFVDLLGGPARGSNRHCSHDRCQGTPVAHPGGASRSRIPTDFV